ncbi:MAG: VWA domain-containing protein [Acidobacteriota bacterium]
MLQQGICRSIATRGLFVACFTLSVNVGWAQNPPQPPTPKPATPQTTPKPKSGPERQGAQADQQPQGTVGESIVIPTELVVLDVSVVDQNNTPVFSLTKEDFSVFEDKVKQELETLSREEVPLSFGVVIDTSGSMRSKLQTVTDAGLSLIKEMRPDDEAFVAEFKDRPELVLDFSKDKRELEEALGELYTSGGTSLLDAIIATADYAHEKGKQRRKALIVITDGLDKNSSVKEKEVMEAMKEDEVQVYLVGFINEDEPAGVFGRSPAKRAKELLTRLAEDSGGRAFFPKEASEMGAIAAQIAKDMRTQYVLSYSPSNAVRDGKFRTVKVTAAPKDGRKLFARTRQGYYAKGDRDQEGGPKRSPKG